ncbi:FadR/GntR family transcriptional regulator [Roseovarius sp. E0-M6]|uniref:FadR/GntR family transcriptional regulator n=1 Tax=Roseovarius sp. E0-M6 TaxID=3127118 RepID=UPI0030104EAC
MSKLGSTDIAALIRREISKGTYRQHERLPASRQMAETYGVARNTLREALIQLEREGLISTRPGSGTYVTHQGSDQTVHAVETANPLELIDARFALEPHLCRLSVLHGRHPDFEQMEALCDQMENSVHDPRAFAEADTAFHRALATSTGNNLLIWVISQINSVRSMDEWTRMRQLTLGPEIIHQYNIQHRQIIDAIRAREPERAANQMKEHLETARLSLTRAADA